MEVLGVLGFVGTAVSLVDFTIRTGYHSQITHLEFKHQQSEYDVIRLTLQEAVRTVVSDGAPTEAVQALMLLCAKLDEQLWIEFHRVERNLKRKRMRAYGLVQVLVRKEERRIAYEAFRDAALLLRDMSHSIQMNRQMSGMRSDIADIQEGSFDEDSESVTDWDPKEYEQSTGVNLEDITQSHLKTLPERPLLKTLTGSNYTFDGTLLWVIGSHVRYTPIRGLWDTGSDAFMITRKIMDRAGIKEEDVEKLENAPTIHGVNGATFKPTLRVKLIWYVNRNMNSQEDTFYVVEEADFDVLVPYTMSIGTRSTGHGKEGQTALILRLRGNKTEEESREEKENEEKNTASRSLRNKTKREEDSKKRKEEIEAREKQAAVNTPAANP